MQQNSRIPVLILAGGQGTRLSEETILKPKPMVEIGDIPILVHIMRWYYSFGFNDFIICAGYKSWDIKNYFLNYSFRQNHLEIDNRDSFESTPRISGKPLNQEAWRVRVLDTGAESLTGARVAKALDLLSQTEEFSDFALTYGDGLGDIDLKSELEFHKKHSRIGTVLGVRPVGRFGVLEVKSDGKVTRFLEKPETLETKEELINGGFFFFRKDFRKYLTTDSHCSVEREPLSKLAKDSELMIYKHQGFWHPMDTLRDKSYLQELWLSKKAPWAV